MTLIPQRRFLRLAAAAWLLASAVLLAAMLARPELPADGRKALSTLLPLYFLSLPLGQAGVLAVGKIKLALWLDNEFVPSKLTEGVVLWAFLTVLGYVQWFLLLPLIARVTRRLFGIHAARTASNAKWREGNAR